MLPYIDVRRLTPHLVMRLENIDSLSAFQYAGSLTGASVDERQLLSYSCKYLVLLMLRSKAHCLLFAVLSFGCCSQAYSRCEAMAEESFHNSVRREAHPFTHYD